MKELEHMNQIEQLRKTIDFHDDKIAENFSARCDTVEQIAIVKSNCVLPTVDLDREKQVTARYTSLAIGRKKLSMRALCNSIMDISKKSQNRVIAIVGMAGVGKSVVGYGVAEKSNMTFFDLDEVIFATFGRENAYSSEKHFRECETECLENLLKNGKNMVISCGGGVTDTTINALILAEKCIVVHLRRNGGLIEKKIDTSLRPFITDIADYEKRKNARERVFVRIADVTIDNNTTIDDAQNKIIEQVAR